MYSHCTYPPPKDRPSPSLPVIIQDHDNLELQAVAADAAAAAQCSELGGSRGSGSRNGLAGFDEDIQEKEGEKEEEEEEVGAAAPAAATEVILGCRMALLLTVPLLFVMFDLLCSDNVHLAFFLHPGFVAPLRVVNLCG